MLLIGVDGGGTKTDCVVAKPKGKVVSFSTFGPSNPRNFGIEESGENIAKAIDESFSLVKEKENIGAIFVGIPAFAEEYKEKEEEIKDTISKNLKKTPVLKEKLFIGSDQEVAFACETKERNGVVVIAGTGSVARGWNNGRDEKTCGCGWLGDTAGAFQIGQEVYKKTIQALDGRIEKSILTKMVLKYFKAQNINEINKKVYKGKHIKVLSPLSIIANKVAKEGDSTAQEILFLKGKDLAKVALNTIKKLEFEKEFPLVLAGSMFKSEIFLKSFKENVLKEEKRAKIIISKKRPVLGALRLAKRNMSF